VSAHSRSVALLRGINVGKHKRIAMADLRDILETLGYEDVKTLLQSGNAVFTAQAEPAVLETQIAKAVAARFGFEVTVMVRSARELAQVVAKNPLPAAVADAAKLHVLFLSAKPAPAILRDVVPADFAPEEYGVAGRQIYVWCRNGVLESKLLAAFSDKRLKVATTARNWNTVTKLAALAASAASQASHASKD
jgi:uncharacterized protein (DUF1697 family)